TAPAPGNVRRPLDGAGPRRAAAGSGAGRERPGTAGGARPPPSGSAPPPPRPPASCRLPAHIVADAGRGTGGKSRGDSDRLLFTFTLNRYSRILPLAYLKNPAPASIVRITGIAVPRMCGNHRRGRRRFSAGARFPAVSRTRRLMMPEAHSHRADNRT